MNDFQAFGLMAVVALTVIASVFARKWQVECENLKRELGQAQTENLMLRQQIREQQKPPVVMVRPEVIDRRPPQLPYRE